eukprot:3267452-Karenia_brevis.AAC.1
MRPRWAKITPRCGQIGLTRPKIRAKMTTDGAMMGKGRAKMDNLGRRLRKDKEQEPSKESPGKINGPK